MTDPSRLSAEAMSAVAQQIHHQLASTIAHPGDVAMTASFLLTNLLALEIASGTDGAVVDHLLDTIKVDARVIAGRIAASSQPAEEEMEPVTVQ